jgi:hypothetical protein
MIVGAPGRHTAAEAEEPRRNDSISEETLCIQQCMRYTEPDAFHVMSQFTITKRVPGVVFANMDMRTAAIPPFLIHIYPARKKNHLAPVLLHSGE